MPGKEAMGWTGLMRSCRPARPGKGGLAPGRRGGARRGRGEERGEEDSSSSSSTLSSLSLSVSSFRWLEDSWESLTSLTVSSLSSRTSSLSWSTWSPDQKKMSKFSKKLKINLRIRSKKSWNIYQLKDDVTCSLQFCVTQTLRLDISFICLPTQQRVHWEGESGLHFVCFESHVNSEVVKLISISAGFMLPWLDSASDWRQLNLSTSLLPKLIASSSLLVLSASGVIQSANHRPSSSSGVEIWIGT